MIIERDVKPAPRSPGSNNVYNITIALIKVRSSSLRALHRVWIYNIMAAIVGAHLAARILFI